MFKDITFAFGRVEDVNDPLKIGRLKVRIFNIHSHNIPIGDLKWYQCINLIQSNSTNQIGISSTGVVIGSWVFGAFLDKNYQDFIVFGSFWGENDPIPMSYGQTSSVLDNKFNKMFDFEEKINYSDVQYPMNKIEVTRSGHIIEYDDSPGNERIHFMHKSGSYIEFMPDGSIQIHATKDFRAGIEGNVKIQVNGNFEISVAGTITQTSGGSTNVNSGGEYTLTSPQENHNKG